MRKATRAQWVKFGIVTLLYLMFLVWVKSWWGLIVLPFIFDIYISKKIPWSFWKKSKNPAVRGIMSWVDAIVFALVAVYFVNIYIFQNYQIPSSSLEKSLLVGDFLYVSKMSYGPRVPNTPLSMPLAQHTLPIFNTKSYIEWPQWKYKRVPGFGKVKLNDIVVFNGNRNIPNSLYLIAKTGDPDMAHQQLDIGTFIIETNGIRWTDDLGSDNYGLPGFWDYKPDGQRWTYFRNSNFSHNTLSIDHRLQNSAGTGEIDRLDNKAAQPFVTMNMSTAYAGQSRFVYRTFRMLDDVRILVTDSIGLQNPSQSVQWSVITSANVECKGNTAVLKKDGKSFSLKIVSPVDAFFTARAAKRGTEAEKPIEGYTILSASVSGEPVQVIKVLLSGE